MNDEACQKNEGRPGVGGGGLALTREGEGSFNTVGPAAAGDELEGVTGQAVQDAEARGSAFAQSHRAAAKVEAERPIRRFPQGSSREGTLAWTELTAVEEFHLGI